MMGIFSEVAGWAGMLIMLLAYYLISNKYVRGTSRVYQSLNLIGAVGICINAYYQEAWPTVGLEAFWILVAINTLTRRKGRCTNG